MLQNEIKKSFIELGLFLSQFSFENYQKNEAVKNNDLFHAKFIDLIQLSQSHNGWFTEENVCFAIQSWANALTEENLNKWLSTYTITTANPKNVGLILAGNIPLVGFHDFLCVLLSGHTALVKTSSNDQHLLTFIAGYLISIDPRIDEKIKFVEGKLEHFDAVIATGSNNTARYLIIILKTNLIL